MFLGLAWYSWLGILGVPSIVSIFGFLFSQGKKINILMKAQQAQMRKQLLDDYHYHKDKGYISEEDMAEWENQYQSYHSLGKNGVLDARREVLLKLPSNKEE